MTELTHRVPLSENWFDPKTSVVYRAFAENGDLLYVGVTSSPHERFYMHQFQSGFWNHVHRIEVSQEFMDRWVAEEAEAKAIRDGQPMCNRWFPLVPESAESIELVFTPFAYENHRRAEWLAARAAGVDVYASETTGGQLK